MRLRQKRVRLLTLPSVLFPSQAMPLHVYGRPSAKVISDSITNDEAFGVVLMREGFEGDLGEPVPHWVGTFARIVACKPSEGGEYHAIAMGEGRFSIQAVARDEKDLLSARIEPLEEDPWRDTAENERLLQRARNSLRRHLEVVFGYQANMVSAELEQDPPALSFAIASCLGLEPLQRQRLLELTDTGRRLTSLLPLLEERTELMHSADPDLTEDLFTEYLSSN